MREGIISSLERGSVKLCLEHNSRDLRRVCLAQDFLRWLKLCVTPVFHLSQSRFVLQSIKICLHPFGKTCKGIFLMTGTWDLHHVRLKIFSFLYGATVNIPKMLILTDWLLSYLTSEIYMKCKWVIFCLEREEIVKVAVVLLTGLLTFPHSCFILQ